MALRTDRVRLAALMHPKEGISFEEFDSYWLGAHSKLFMSLEIVQKNLLKYEQFHFSPQVNDALAAQGGPRAPYYGIAIFEAESFDKIIEVFTSPEYLRVVVPDEQKFFDRTKSTMVGGPFAEIISK